jgi:16S rRNA (guanine1207-N2)-methyltransferase
MCASRLSTALAERMIALPEGDVHVMRPGIGTDLSPLLQGRCSILATFRPEADHWAAQGWRVWTGSPPSALALALVCLPRDKALARGMLALAGAIAPEVWVDGQKTDGIDSLWREVRARLGDVPSLTKAHGRLMWFRPGDRLAEWAQPGPAPGPGGLYTQAGVFSGDGPDPGSALLAAALPARLPPRMADLGAGIGVLARAVLGREGVQHLDVIEAESLALDCARLNVTDPRAAFHWVDATAHDPRAPWDGVVMNPPFHRGRAGDPALGQAFIAAAARGLSPQGQLWLVANRHLPYEATLAQSFRDVAEIGGSPAFKLFHAARPRR